MTKDEFAQQVNADVGIEISIILAIASFILQNCILNKKRVQSPSLLDKVRLKMAIRRVTKQKNRELYEAFLHHGSGLDETALKSMGAKLE
jgi:hypothetical protein